MNTIDYFYDGSFGQSLLCLAFFVVLPLTVFVVYFIQRDKQLKACPACRGKIHREATRCRYCGERLDDSTAGPGRAAAPARRRP
jgi:hypothetical protein